VNDVKKRIKKLKLHKSKKKAEKYFAEQYEDDKVFFVRKYLRFQYQKR